MSAPATLAGVVGVADAVVQLGYGFMATAWPYPTITDPPYEVTWAVVNIGMVATVVRLALLVRPRFGRLALAGAALAIAGHLARIMVAVLSAIGLADEGTAADGAIVVSILDIAAAWVGIWCPGGDRHRLFRPSRLGVDVPGLPHPWRGAVHRGRDP